MEFKTVSKSGTESQVGNGGLSLEVMFPGHAHWITWCQGR